MPENNRPVFFEPQAGGRFDVIVPAIPEIYTFGETLEEAREIAKDAIHSYLGHEPQRCDSSL